MPVTVICAFWARLVKSLLRVLTKWWVPVTLISTRPPSKYAEAPFNCLQFVSEFWSLVSLAKAFHAKFEAPANLEQINQRASRDLYRNPASLELKAAH